MALTQWDRRLLWVLALAALVRLVFLLSFWDLDLRSDELPGIKRSP